MYASKICFKSEEKQFNNLKEYIPLHLHVFAPVQEKQSKMKKKKFQESRYGF